MAQAVLGRSNLPVKQIRACNVQSNDRIFPNSKIGKPDMELSASGRIIHGMAPALALLLLGSPAAAQTPKKSDNLENIALCNGSDRTSLESRIDACTALIDSGQGTTTALGYRPQQSWQCLYRKGRPRPRHPGFRPIDQARSGLRQALQQPRCSLLEERRIRPRDQSLSMRRSGSIPTTAELSPTVPEST